MGDSGVRDSEQQRERMKRMANRDEGIDRKSQRQADGTSSSRSSSRDARGEFRARASMMEKKKKPNEFD